MSPNLPAFTQLISLYIFIVIDRYIEPAAAKRKKLTEKKKTGSGQATTAVADQLLVGDT